MSKLLNRCPCGDYPVDFTIVTDLPAKWVIATPTCCNEWHFEFRSHYETDRHRIQELAGQAWNELPRGVRWD